MYSLKPLYPVQERETTYAEKCLLNGEPLIYQCSVCGFWGKTQFRPGATNFREDLLCPQCGAWNRQRQIAAIICMKLGISSLADLPQDLWIWNLETTRALHNHLADSDHYFGTEYFGPKYKSGEIINGVEHQDVENPSYQPNTFDMVVSSDIMEHVPGPYWAFRQIWNVLKVGGMHIFTAPFDSKAFLDDNRAILGENGRPILKKPAIFHLDPLDPDGCLVYNIFGLEMLVSLAKIGFHTEMFHIYNEYHGIVGPDAFVFCSTKMEHPLIP